MGQDNRARRAARQRDRRARAARAAEGPASPPPDPLSGEQIARLLPTAAAAVAAGVPQADHYLAVLGEYDEQDQARVDHCVAALLTGLVGSAWERGWLPTDLSQYGRRRLDPAGEALLVAAIGAAHGAFTDAGIDPRWLDQLAGLGLTERPFPALDLNGWAAGARVGRYLALHTALAVAGFLQTLPRLARLLPLPGSATGAGTGPGGSGTTTIGAAPTSPAGRAGNDQKMLGRIRALLAKAERTEFPDEAEALSTKAQELMAKFSLDRALVEAEPDSGFAAGSGARRIWVDTPYVSAKAQLVAAVASANHCRAVSTDQLAMVTVVGAELELELTELLSTSLLVQANRAMLAAGSHVGRYGESRTRSFRQSFLMAYAQRIGERLQATSEATRAAVTDAEADRLLPVLGRRAERVDALFTKLFPDTVLRRTRVSNGAGWAAGLSAADKARLDTRPAVRRS